MYMYIARTRITMQITLQQYNLQATLYMPCARQPFWHKKYGQFAENYNQNCKLPG
jgi:hypothetical protein